MDFPQMKLIVGFITGKYNVFANCDEFCSMNRCNKNHERHEWVISSISFCFLYKEYQGN